MEHDRCIIACRWFYESSGTETRISESTGRTIKQQYMFTIPRMPVIFIGGIHRSHEYSMVTTRANASMAPVHPRMPLILHPNELTTWPIKQQYMFTIPRMPVIFIGGIHRSHEYSMVTTRANASMAPVHPRMPLILHPNELTTWLVPDYMRLADRSAVPIVAQPVH